MEPFWVPKEPEGSSELVEVGGCPRKPPKEDMSVLGCEGGTEPLVEGAGEWDRKDVRPWKGGLSARAP